MCSEDSEILCSVICLVTKAIHLESVEDYTTTSFLAVFRRFVSRRGLPVHMYSDNGTNFHGADQELQTSFRAMSSDSTLQVTLASDGVQWHFIPSAASHFGGL
jgi:imidazoleglycerol phosphate dehydratase HisB